MAATTIDPIPPLPPRGNIIRGFVRHVLSHTPQRMTSHKHNAGYFNVAKRAASRPDSWQVRHVMLVFVADSGLSFHCRATFA